jgi:hypothetical protein
MIALKIRGIWMSAPWWIERQAFYPDRQREEDLPRRREPDAGLTEPGHVRVVDEVQPRPRGRAVRTGRQRQDDPGEHDREDEQDRHADPCEFLDAAGVRQCIPTR